MVNYFILYIRVFINRTVYINAKGQQYNAAAAAADRLR